MPLDIPHVQETQAEAPGLLHPRQPEQQVGDLLVLVIAIRAVPIASLATSNARQASAMLTPFIATALTANSRR